MPDRSVEHATFAIERTYEVAPARVFAAWAEPEAKARWFGPSEGSRGEYQLDFRLGGRERLEVATSDGTTYRFDACYQEIVADRRVIYSYEMHRDTTRISVSLATVEFEQHGAGTKLTFTEQAAFLDAQDTPAERERGTGLLLEGLAAELQRQAG